MILRVKRIPFGFAAMTLPTIIFIREGFPAEIEEVLVAHERIHQRQQKNWLYFPIYVVRYFMSKSFRIRMESEAYAENVRRGTPIMEVARVIHDRYSSFGPIKGFGEWPSVLKIAIKVLEYV